MNQSIQSESFSHFLQFISFGKPVFWLTWEYFWQWNPPPRCKSVYFDDYLVTGMRSEWEQCCFIGDLSRPFGLRCACQSYPLLIVLVEIVSSRPTTRYRGLHHRVPYLMNCWRLCLPIFFFNAPRSEGCWVVQFDFYLMRLYRSVVSYNGCLSCGCGKVCQHWCCMGGWDTMMKMSTTTPSMWWKNNGSMIPNAGFVDVHVKQQSIFLTAVWTRQVFILLMASPSLLSRMSCRRVSFVLHPLMLAFIWRCLKCKCDYICTQPTLDSMLNALKWKRECSSDDNMREHEIVEMHMVKILVIFHHFLRKL